jgi:membrane protein implicated in regulation of membrane protease activity
VYFPIIPAIWIGMAIGGVHSAGVLSFIVGLTITALVYALLASTLVRLWQKVFRKQRRSERSRTGTDSWRNNAP